jgi:hypothetical protein
MTASLIYRGDLICELTHERSGTAIITDAPVDNKGNGSAFSLPTWSLRQRRRASPPRWALRRKRGTGISTAPAWRL